VLGESEHSVHEMSMHDDGRLLKMKTRMKQLEVYESLAYMEDFSRDLDDIRTGV